jgi:hypothetical protein
MKLERIVLAPKLTGLEYDMHRYNLTLAQTLDFYRRRGLDPTRLHDSHARQKENLARVAEAFPGARVVTRHELSKQATEDADVVVSLGGDNHLTYVAHYTEAPILGLNLNPESSSGVLLGFSCDRLEQVLEVLAHGAYEIEEWPRIRVEIDGRVVESAVTECYLGEAEPFFASYHFLRWNGQTTIHRGSGTLVVNGAGSTGWYLTASRFAAGAPFARTARALRFLSREPFLADKYNAVVGGEVADGEVLEVTSNDDNHGIVVCDSLAEFRFDFLAGSVARLGLDARATRILWPRSA